MSTQVAAMQQRSGAGWYPDPHGPAGRLRWWDGRRWNPAVHATSTSTSTSTSSQTAHEISASPPVQRPPRRRRTIAWAALGAFALGVSGVVIGVRRGQDVCEVSATGTTFCANDGEAVEQVERGQPVIEEQVGELESAAAAQAEDQPALGSADLSGTWTGDDGFLYEIEQFDDQAVITELSLDGLALAVGTGTVDGTTFGFTFEALDGSFGTATLELDGDTLSGTFTNDVTGISVPAVLRR